MPKLPPPQELIVLFLQKVKLNENRYPDLLLFLWIFNSIKIFLMEILQEKHQTKRFCYCCYEELFYIWQEVSVVFSFLHHLNLFLEYFVHEKVIFEYYFWIILSLFITVDYFLFLKDFCFISCYIWIPGLLL